MLCLSDSAAYKLHEGEKTGFETRLREIHPDVLDTDVDICHHMHNSVRKFCETSFDNHVEHLCDDLYNDFQYSPDLNKDLEGISSMFGLNFKVPLERIAHRWLLAYHVSTRNVDMMDPRVVFYFAWIGNDKGKYLPLFKEVSG